MTGVHSLVLAAGKGTRMKSELPKVVHQILGKPMLGYVVDALKKAGCSQTSVITGYKSQLVKQSMAAYDDLQFFEQSPQLGTGHAVQCYAKNIDIKPSHLLVVCGDTPLISSDTLSEMLDIHMKKQPAITMMTLNMTHPGNYGRIIRKDNDIIAVREAKDCTNKQLQIKEVNLAIYLFEGSFLFDNIFKLDNNNRQKEYYLTDLVEMAATQGKKIIGCLEKDESSTLGINSRMHMAQVTSIIKHKTIVKLMESGVTIADPLQTTIGPDVKIMPDSCIYPGTVITGESEIGSGCNIGPNCKIESAVIEDNCHIEHSVVTESRVKKGTVLKPFTHISN